MKRKSNFELIRIVAMLFIVGLHTVNKGGALWLSEWGSFNHLGSWFLEACFLVSVDLFFMLTGWFCVESHFQTKKVIHLWIRTLFYSALIFLVFWALGMQDLTRENLHKALLPISSGNYWFITNYLVLMLFLPFLNKLLFALKSRGRITLTSILILVYCVWRAVIIFSNGIEDNPGYSFGWTVSIYLIMATLRLGKEQNDKFLKIGTLKCLVGFLGFSTCTFVTRYVLTNVGGQDYSLKFITYNSPAIVLAALCAFCFFMNLSITSAKVASGINFIAKHAVAVYLIHDNPFVRDVLWQTLALDSYCGTLWLLPACAAAIFGIYIVCTLLDILLDPVVQCITQTFCKWIEKPIDHMDTLMGNL